MITPRRPEEIAAKYNRLYPEAWRQIDEFRSMRGTDLPAWPDWCFCPMAGAYAIVSGGGGNRVPMERTGHISAIAGLSAWRPTKGVYAFDPELFDSLITTDLDGNLPTELFFRMPDWSHYIPIPEGRSLGLKGDNLAGFFAYLEHDAENGRAELRFLLDYPDVDDLLPAGIHLNATTIQEAVGKFAQEADRQVATMDIRKGLMLPNQGSFNSQTEMMVALLTPLVCLTLYLCSTNADISHRGVPRPHPTRPLPTKTKKGLRLFPAEKQAQWDVGWRIGSALRAARDVFERGDGGGEAGRGSVRPHTRKAHFHLYWTGEGSRKDPSKAVGVLKWLPPLPVGVKSLDDLVPTVHPVQR